MTDHDDMTIADVMSSEELAEYDRDTEFRLDAADDERNAALVEAEEQAADSGNDEECVPELIDGSYEGCGVCLACLDAAATADEEATR